jgi:TusA-related sulfurtransferase
MDSIAFAAKVFVDALLWLDFEGMESTLESKVEFRALVPGELVNVATAPEAVQCFRRWFGDKTDLELLHHKSEVLIDRLLLDYRLCLYKGDQPYFVEQRICSASENGKFAVIDMVCSGFRPEGVVETAASVHGFDAGDLGCGSGLPREFRARIRQIPVGHILEVVTKDPSAREDLPSISRLLGHKVRSVEPGAEGEFIIRVESAK